MEEISVTRTGPERVNVEVVEGGTRSVHDVTIPTADVERLAPGSEADVLVEESFRFLLEREPKEAILRTFDLTEIARYFPEYPEEIRKRLEG